MCIMPTSASVYDSFLRTEFTAPLKVRFGRAARIALGVAILFAALAFILGEAPCARSTVLQFAVPTVLGAGLIAWVTARLPRRPATIVVGETGVEVRMPCGVDSFLWSDVRRIIACRVDVFIGDLVVLSFFGTDPDKALATADEQMEGWAALNATITERYTLDPKWITNVAAFIDCGTRVAVWSLPGLCWACGTDTVQESTGGPCPMCRAPLDATAATAS